MSENLQIGTSVSVNTKTKPDGSVLGNAATGHKGGNPWHDAKTGRFTTGPAGQNEAVRANAGGKNVLPIDKMMTLVSNNNLYASNLPNNILIALIYKESTFDANSKSKTTTSIGLAQINKNMVKDVNNQFGTNYDYEKLYDPATSVKVASLTLEVKDNYARGSGYNNPSDPSGSNKSWYSALYAYIGSNKPSVNKNYADSIIRAANYLSKNPTNPLYQLKKILHGK